MTNQHNYTSNFRPDDPFSLDYAGDGGYYNDWDFDANLVEKYLKVMNFEALCRAGLQELSTVEIFRSFCIYIRCLS